MKEKLSRKVSRILTAIKKAPEKKTHLDFIAALLTIPVLLSVIILNYSNLNNLQKKTTVNASPTPAPTQQVIIVSPSQTPAQTDNNLPPIQSCKEGIGPLSISYPAEGQTISDNPVCVNINYSDPSYCSVVWSYRINGGQWSDYNSNSPCLYNMPNGNIKFELRVQSTVAQNQTQTYTRNFVYNGQGTVATPSPTPSPSPTPTPSPSSTPTATP